MKDLIEWTYQVWRNLREQNLMLITSIRLTFILFIEIVVGSTKRYNNNNNNNK